MNNGFDGLNHSGGIFMLEDVVPDGHNTAFNDGLERFSAAGMVDLHMICPRFRDHTSGVFHNRYAAFRFDGIGATVQHFADSGFHDLLAGGWDLPIRQDPSELLMSACYRNSQYSPS